MCAFEVHFDDDADCGWGRSGPTVHKAIFDAGPPFPGDLGPAAGGAGVKDDKAGHKASARGGAAAGEPFSWGVAPGGDTAAGGAGVKDDKVGHKASSTPWTVDLPVGAGGLRVVGRRLDAVVVYYKVKLPRDVMPWRPVGEGRSAVGAAEVQLVGVASEQTGEETPTVALKVSAISPSKVRFENSDLSGTVTDIGSRLVEVQVEMRAVYLAQHPVSDVLGYALSVASALGEVLDERLRRVDFACDVAGWAVSETEKAGWLTRQRSKLGSHTDLDDMDRASRGLAATGRDVVHGGQAGRPVQGFTVSAGGPVMARIYDKRLQLATKAPEKAALEEGIWRSHGWDGVAPVARVEFQLRTAALKCLRLRKPADLDVSLDAVWQYLSRDWLRLVVPGSSPRPSRCDDDVRWALVQKVVFAHDGVAPAKRSKIRGGASAKHAMGTVLSFTASQGVRVGLLPLIMVGSDPAAEVRATLRALGQAWADATADALIAEHGAELALAYVQIRITAADAKASAMLLLFEPSTPGEVPAPLRPWMR